MMCKYPVNLGSVVVGCGRCLHCRANRRREWVHRILLEQKEHDFNTFLTLTYDDDHLPADHSLNPLHLKNFLRSIRRKSGYPIRYYAVGEYGEDKNQTGIHRPHYHIALFGHPNCNYGRTRNKPLCCSICTKVRKSWKHGNVYLGELTEHSAAYIAGYILKKLDGNNEKLGDRYPEFARMSRKPGIGLSVVDTISEALLKHGAKEVPFYLKHGKKNLPLDYYTRDKISKKTKLPKAKKTETHVQHMYETEEIRQTPRPLRQLAVEHMAADQKKHRRDYIERRLREKSRRKQL